MRERLSFPSSSPTCFTYRAERLWNCKQDLSVLAKIIHFSRYAIDKQLPSVQFVFCYQIFKFFSVFPWTTPSIKNLEYLSPGGGGPVPSGVVSSSTTCFVAKASIQRRSWDSGPWMNAKVTILPGKKDLLLCWVEWFMITWFRVISWEVCDTCNS